MATFNRPQAKLKQNPFAPPDFRFPVDLGGVGEEPYVIFDIRSAIAKGGRRLRTIALPFPFNGVQVSYATQYSEENVGFDQLVQLVKSGQADSMGTLTDVGAELIAGAFSDSNASSALERERGAIINPFAAVFFKGVGFRRFQFDFQMLARNQAESDQIRNIISYFKFHMHPSIPDDQAKKRFFLYPDIFVIGLFSPEDDYLFKISACALTNMTVDYAGSGVPAFFKFTGAPVDIRMSLQFQELEVMTKEKIMKGF